MSGIRDRAAPAFNHVEEFCERCGDERPHEVTIAMFDISRGTADEKYSRQPHRVTRCRTCGAERTHRVDTL